MAPSINRRGAKRTMRLISLSVSLEIQGLVRASCMNRRLVGLMPAVKPGSSNGAVPLTMPTRVSRSGIFNAQGQHMARRRNTRKRQSGLA
jgi:hypothetical protein